MEIYYQNLYENVFSEKAKEYTCLRIISGYASSDFLSRIISEFPNLKIELFLGMTFQGISKSDHYGYKTLMQENDNVMVYYQVLGLPNHMKIYEFSNASRKETYIGSANFSENGFFHHKEILAEVTQLPEIIFGEQRRNSLLCTESLVEQHIEFYENELKKAARPEEDLEKKRKENEYKLVNREKREKAKHRWGLLRGNMDPRYYLSFEITAMLPHEHNPRWHDRGINSWVNGKTPVIEQTPRLSFTKVFPLEEFIIYTDDNQVINARLTGKFNGNLEFLNIDLYDYIRERIGLLEKRAISHYDLVLAGYATLYFTRVNYTEFIMSFHNEDKLF